MSQQALFDVLGVNLETKLVRVMARDKTEENASAFIDMAVMRRGVDDEFFASAPSGMYSDGDKWTGDGT